MQRSTVVSLAELIMGRISFSGHPERVIPWWPDLIQERITMKNSQMKNQYNRTHTNCGPLEIGY